MVPGRPTNLVYSRSNDCCFDSPDLWDGQAVLAGVVGWICCFGRSCEVDRLLWQKL